MRPLNNQQRSLNRFGNRPQPYSNYPDKPFLPRIVSISSVHEAIQYADVLYECNQFHLTTDPTAAYKEPMVQESSKQVQVGQSGNQYISRDEDHLSYNNIRAIHLDPNKSNISDRFPALLLYREKLIEKYDEMFNDTSSFWFNFSNYRQNLTADQIRYYMKTYQFVMEMLEWHRQEIKNVNTKLNSFYFSFDRQVADFKQTIETFEKPNGSSNLSNFSTSPKYNSKRQEPYRLCHLPNTENLSNNRSVLNMKGKNSTKQEAEIGIKRYSRNMTYDDTLSSSQDRTKIRECLKAKILNKRFTDHVVSERKDETCDIDQDSSVQVTQSSGLSGLSNAIGCGGNVEFIASSSNDNASLSDKDNLSGSFSDEESIGELVIDERF